MRVFKAQRVSRTQTIELIAPPSHVFPLFNYMHQEKWSPDWEYQLIYSPNGDVVEGSVFKTKRERHLETIWTVIKYDRERYQIEYLRLNPQTKLGVIQIYCEDNFDGTTTTKITYAFTSLSEKGNDYIKTFSPQHFYRWMKSWEKDINLYLKSKMIPVAS